MPMWQRFSPFSGEDDGSEAYGWLKIAAPALDQTTFKSTMTLLDKIGDDALNKVIALAANATTREEKMLVVNIFHNTNAYRVELVDPSFQRTSLDHAQKDAGVHADVIQHEIDKIHDEADGRVNTLLKSTLPGGPAVIAGFPTAVTIAHLIYGVLRDGIMRNADRLHAATRPPKPTTNL